MDDPIRWLALLLKMRYLVPLSLQQLQRSVLQQQLLDLGSVVQHV
ncbi:Uncharacterised protein [Serratia liquefaciens]|nr:Uncharacterised protein [Serratia liquefaciens]CAI1144026.1 Uncharacterised protein [Serratia liquefaciens]